MSNRRSTRLLSFLLTCCLLLAAVFPYCIPRASAAYRTGVYKTFAYLNFRRAPSTDSEIYELLPPDTSVEVTRVDGTWGNITYNGQTGWVSLDYCRYYTVSNKPKLSEPWLIMDISYWTPTEKINWDGIKADGVQGVIIRVGGRGYGGSRAIYTDELFSTHYQNAKAAGLHVGVYFFSYAMNEAEAIEEARFTIDRLAYCGCELDMPVFIDIEDIDSRNQHYRAGKQVCTAVVDAFCNEIQSAGYYPGVYSGKSFAETLLDTAVLENRAVWIAHYRVSACGYQASDIDMWQYTDAARIPSVSTGLDLSECYVDFPTLIRNSGHTYSFLEYSEMPSLFEGGTALYVCAHCGETELRAVEPLLLGDVTGDRAVTAEDARAALRIAVGLDAADAIKMLTGDVTGDDAVTSDDARLILRIAVGLEESESLLRLYHKAPLSSTDPETPLSPTDPLSAARLSATGSRAPYSPTDPVT